MICRKRDIFLNAVQLAQGANGPAVTRNRYRVGKIAQKNAKIQEMSLSTMRCLPATFWGRGVSWKSVICSIFCKLEISSRYCHRRRYTPFRLSIPCLSIYFSSCVCVLRRRLSTKNAGKWFKKAERENSHPPPP